MVPAVAPETRSDAPVGARLEGKYLTFRLAGEEYGLQILKVQEIIHLQTITKVPRTPAAVSGVINLRGKVIPVVDLRARFAMELARDTEKSCIIVVQIRSRNGALVVGILIDEVSEVLDIPADSIEGRPDFGFGVDTDFILGMGKVNGSVKILLDIDRVLAGDELDELEAAATR